MRARQNVPSRSKMASKPWNRGHDLFNQNPDRSDREKWSTSKGGPVFLKLFRLNWNFRKFWLNGSRPAWHTEWLLYHVRYTNSKRSPMSNALRIYNTSIRIYNVLVNQIKASTPPPPLRATPGDLTFLKIIVQIPSYQGLNAVQMPPLGSIQVIKCPHPGTFHRHINDRKTAETPSVVEQNLCKYSK